MDDNSDVRGITKRRVKFQNLVHRPLKRTLVSDQEITQQATLYLYVDNDNEESTCINAQQFTSSAQGRISHNI